jgi:hypothetical protein
MIEPLGRKGNEPLIVKTIEFTAQPVNQRTESSLVFIYNLYFYKL